MNKWLYFSWGILYALSAVLGLVQDPSETQKLLMLIFSLTFFVPGFLLLYNAIQSGNRKGVLTVRLISLASLVLTTGGLVAMLLSAGTGSEVATDVTYYVLAVVSVPMLCSQIWVVSLFLWACLLFSSFIKKKSK